MEALEICPVCNNDKWNLKLECTDYLVSGKVFGISLCEHCGLLATNPRPPANEIGKYYKAESYISHTDTDKGIISKIYKTVRNITIKKKYNLLRKYMPEAKNILDVGCGTGYFLSYCREQGMQVTGVEPDIDARKFCVENQKLDVYEEQFLKNNQNLFDIITLWHVLEHVHDLNARISELKAILSEKGILIIALPNPLSHDALHYNKYWAAYDVPRHLYHFTPDVIKKLLDNHGFSCLSVKPMKYDAYYVSMLSEQHKRGKPSLLPAVFRGFLSNCKAKPENYSSQIYIFSRKR